MGDKQHWEHVYATRSPLDVSWFQTEPSVSLELISASGVALWAPLIDVGGGASRLVDHLQERGHSNVAVLDLSGKALDHARQRLGVRSAGVEWYEQDVTRFCPSRRFALWHDRAVFHFLTERSDRERYVDALRRTLVPGGHLIMAAFAVGGPTMCSNLPIVQYDAERLLNVLGREFKLMEERTEAHITPAGKEQQFGYFRLMRL